MAGFEGGAVTTVFVAVTVAKGTPGCGSAPAHLLRLGVRAFIKGIFLKHLTSSTSFAALRRKLLAASALSPLAGMLASREALAKPLLMQSAPDFVLNTLDGSPLRLSDQRGQVVMVNFWATWCAQACCGLRWPPRHQVSGTAGQRQESHQALRHGGDAGHRSDRPHGASSLPPPRLPRRARSGLRQAGSRADQGLNISHML